MVSGLKDRKTKPLIPCHFLCFLLFFNWKTQGALAFLLVSFTPLVCWINHFNPAINPWTNGWMSLPSDYWFTNRHLFFKKNSIWNIEFYWTFWFVFLLFLPLSPLPGVFQKTEEEDSSETVLISTQQQQQQHTAIKHRSLAKQHTHIHPVCVTILTKELY